MACLQQLIWELADNANADGAAGILVDGHTEEAIMSLLVPGTAWGRARITATGTQRGDGSYTLHPYDSGSLGLLGVRTLGVHGSCDDGLIPFETCDRLLVDMTNAGAYERVDGHRHVRILASRATVQRVMQASPEKHRYGDLWWSTSEVLVVCQTPCGFRNACLQAAYFSALREAWITAVMRAVCLKKSCK
jgi:hypothetical protein